MANPEDRLKVLKMIQEGKISPEEAGQLLDLLEEGAPEVAAAAPNASGGKWFRVRVTDTATGKTRTNLRIPLGMVNAGLKLGMRFTPEIEGLELDKISQWIQDGQIGQLLDVEDDADGERVEITIE